MSDFTPTPQILDTSVLIDIIRGDPDLISFLQHLDRAGQPIVIPSLAVTGALLDTRGVEDGPALLAGLAAFERAIVAPLDGVVQAAGLTEMIALTGLSPWDAHVATIADIAVCPILTLDQTRWEAPSAALEQPLHIIEITDDPD